MKSRSIASKLPQVGTTIFTVMSALAQEYQAVNLSQGFPDFPCDKELAKRVGKYIRKGFNQYAPMPGLLALREQIAGLTQQIYGASYDPKTEITVTSGATEALFCAITAIIREGDEVIIIEPAYDSYIPAITLSGGIPVSVTMEFPGYKINWEQVKKLINGKTRAIMLNSPHNPTGATLKSEDLLELGKILNENNIFVISDEVWEHTVYDGQKHQSVASYPELAKRAFIISSFGKALHTTGWKVGYCLAPEALTEEFRKIHQYVTFSTSTPFQYAIADYIEHHADRILDLPVFYQKKRDLFLELIKGSRFTPLHASGTYFQLLHFKGITEESDFDFAKRLTIEHKIASIPISGFYRGKEDNQVLRFCFAKKEPTLKKAAKILKTI